MKILIADDEDLIRYDVKAILLDLDSDLEIYEAANGRELMESVQRIQPEASFVDIRMPGFSGLKAIEKLLAMNVSTQFVILTGHADFDYARKGLQLGVVDYLLKPVNSSELEHVLNILNKTRGLYSTRNNTVQRLPNSGEDPLSKSAVLADQAELLIREHFKEPVGVAQIAEMLNVTPNYLSAQFKQWKGLSFTSFITQLRLECARHMLRQPGASVKQVCSDVGYVSPRHFARLFRERYNIAPSQYIVGGE